MFALFLHPSYSHTVSHCQKVAGLDGALIRPSISFYALMIILTVSLRVLLPNPETPGCYNLPEHFFSSAALFLSLP